MLLLARRWHVWCRAREGMSTTRRTKLFCDLRCNSGLLLWDMPCRRLPGGFEMVRERVQQQQCGATS